MRQLERHPFRDAPIRLGPIAIHSAPASGQGRCAACEGLLSREERVVRIYGEVFHSQCAFYPPRDGQREQD
jgi:hypothetical protein